jgi:hypothetical protein
MKPDNLLLALRAYAYGFECTFARDVDSGEVVTGAEEAFRSSYGLAPANHGVELIEVLR